MKFDSIETRFSNFHYLVFTILKTKITEPFNLEPRKVVFRNYDTFVSESFKTDVRKAIEINVNDHVKFESEFLSLLDKDAPNKTKIIHANSKPDVAKRWIICEELVHFQTVLKIRPFLYLSRWNSELLGKLKSELRVRTFSPRSTGSLCQTAPVHLSESLGSHKQTRNLMQSWCYWTKPALNENIQM